jgi:predicted branched-subunit amino acid permease
LLRVNETPPPLGTRGALLAGARAAIPAPALVLGASYVGFGSLVGAHSLPLEFALFSTLTAWALPGQVALVELYLAGSGLFAIALAVGLANMRLAPMTVAMMPLVAVSGRPAWRLYGAAFYVAVTCWAMTMAHGPALHRQDRLSWFVGAALAMWTASLVGTVVGYYAAAHLPAPLTLALVFLNPVYFLLLFLQSAGDRTRLVALLAGGVLCVPAQLYSPEWSLLVAGIAGGTLAVALKRVGRTR